MQLKMVVLCAALAIAPGTHAPFAQTATPSDVTDPQSFAEMAGSSNMFEIESSQLALERAEDEDVRAFAEMMVQDHTAAGDKMKTAAEADGVTPPAAMLEKHQGQLDQLGAAKGSAFDQAYLDAQAVAHEEAVSLFETFSTEGEESALRDFAAETLPTLEEHKAQVNALTGG